MTDYQPSKEAVARDLLIRAFTDGFANGRTGPKDGDEAVAFCKHAAPRAADFYLHAHPALARTVAAELVPGLVEAARAVIAVWDETIADGGLVTIALPEPIAALRAALASQPAPADYGTQANPKADTMVGEPAPAGVREPEPRPDLAAAREKVAAIVKPHPDDSHGDGWWNAGVRAALRILDVALDAPCDLRPTAYGQWCELHFCPVGNDPEHDLADGRCLAYRRALLIPDPNPEEPQDA